MFDIQVFRECPFPLRAYDLNQTLAAARKGCSFCGLVIHHMLPKREDLQRLLDRDDEPYEDTLSQQVDVETMSSILSPVSRFITRLNNWMWPLWIHFMLEYDPHHSPELGMGVVRLRATIRRPASLWWTSSNILRIFNGPTKSSGNFPASPFGDLILQTAADQG